MKLAQKKMYKQYGKAIRSGVKGIFTMHGNSIEDVKMNKEIDFLIETKQIEKIIDRKSVV